MIAAAFIGPGTVTTAAAAGAGHGLGLLWALLFSTVACFVLQEAARLTIVSGRDLATALRQRFRPAAPIAAALAIVLGCAAYEAGNLLGGVAGARLVWPQGTTVVWTVALAAGAAALLLAGAPRSVARLLAVAVAVMGIAFLATAVALRPDPLAVAEALVVPRIPPGAELLVLGLLGTTVVPYNLFLGSGLAAGERLETMRFGLAVAVGLGGLVSMGVLVAGTAVAGELTFEGLGEVLATRVGQWARPLFGLGLLAAGFSSAVTAPLAAAITLRGVATRPGREPWAIRSWRFRAVWGGVLLVGLGFGVSGVRPIPVILAAQALNGLLLPLVAIFLLVATNDRGLLGDRINGRWANLAAAVVTGVTILLGLLQVARATAGFLGRPAPQAGPVAAGALLLVAVAAVPLGRRVARGRRALPLP